jgi:hypothetical protein
LSKRKKLCRAYFSSEKSNPDPNRLDSQDCLFELLEEAAEFLSGSRTALAFPRWLPALRDVILLPEL